MAYEIGANRIKVQVTEDERLRFEQWMAGHCWKVSGEWTGSTYLGATENGEYLDPQAMHTRQLFAAWRDNAALRDNLEAQGRDDMSVRIAELEAQLVAEAARTANEKLRADQMTEQHRMQCKLRAELEVQLAARCLHQIQEPEGVQSDAERWQAVLRRVGAERVLGHNQYVLHDVKAPVNVMQGSTAMHFTKSIDAAIAAQAQQGEQA